jgi:hypothetical protein
VVLQTQTDAIGECQKVAKNFLQTLDKILGKEYTMGKKKKRKAQVTLSTVWGKVVEVAALVLVCIEVLRFLHECGVLQYAA